MATYQTIDKAIADFDKATTLKTKHIQAHQYFGDALHQAGKEYEAEIQWEIAKKLRKKKQIILSPFIL